MSRRLIYLLWAIASTTLGIGAVTQACADELTQLLAGTPSPTAVNADQVIMVASSERSDQDIRQRLQAIFSELETLAGVEVEVTAGVVSLTGKVANAMVENRALGFARRVEGVVAVENHLNVDRDLQPRLRTTGQKLVDLSRNAWAVLPLFLLALAVFSLFLLTGRWLAAQSGWLDRLAPNPFIANLFSQLLRVVFTLLGLSAALALLDATALLGTVLGAAGIIGLAVGFAVRDTVENYIASILLSLRNPFEVNDFVDIDGHEGNVVKLTSRATILLSPDGNHIRIPNATVFKAVVTNFTRHPERRFEFDVGVDTDQDLQAAQRLALLTLSGTHGVLADPRPLVVVQMLGDSNVVLRCYGWVDQRHFGFLKVRSEAIRVVKHAFDGAGIVMPEPVYKVRLFEPQGEPEVTGNRRSAGTQGSTIHGGSAAAVGSVATAGDMSVDLTIERKVAEQERQAGRENLLDAATSSEI